MKKVTVSGIALAAVVALAVFGVTSCSKKNGTASGSARAAGEKVTITNVSYDPTRELYASYNKVWKAGSGSSKWS